MAAANPQPLQERPFEELDRLPAHFEDDDDGRFEDDTVDVVDDGNLGSVNVAEHGLGLAGGGVAMALRTSELTLSFEGEVYVFPAVTPEKVCFLFQFQLILLHVSVGTIVFSHGDCFKMMVYVANITVVCLTMRKKR